VTYIYFDSDFYNLSFRVKRHMASVSIHSLNCSCTYLWCSAVSDNTQLSADHSMSQCHTTQYLVFNPLTLTVAIWVQPWASECPDVKNYKWWLNPVWHRMLYSCNMATVSINGLIIKSDRTTAFKSWINLYKLTAFTNVAYGTTKLCNKMTRLVLFTR